MNRVPGRPMHAFATHSSACRHPRRGNIAAGLSARRYLLPILLLCTFAQGLLAQQRPYQPGYPMPGQMYPQPFRPVPESNARGKPPTAPPTPQTGYGYPWGYPGQSSQAAGQQPAPSARAPYLETTLDAPQAWVQQTLVLRLDVISGSNLSNVQTQLPSSEDVVFRALGDPQAEVRTRDGTREIINRLYYLMVPLHAGEIDLDPIRVHGVFADGRAFDARDTEGLHLSVQPALEGARTWLPLESLELDARLSNDQGVSRGEPLTLTIEQNVIGATGHQLPSPEAQLRLGDLRVYREQTDQEGQVGTDGKLHGRRVDTFTLIPPKDRALQIPTVKVTWWNTRYGRQEIAILPGRVLNAAAGYGDQFYERDDERPLFSGAPPWVFWLPLAIGAFVIGLYWTLIWARGRHIRARLRAEFGPTFAPLLRHLGVWQARLSPQRHLHVLRRRFANSLPRSYRLWFCVRAADDENDPADWGQVLRFLVQRRLGAPAQVPMARLAEIIIELHPGARPERVRNLLAQLDSAMYGRGELSNFAAWKKAFKREIRPHLWPRRRAPGNQPIGLPALNPPG